MSNKETVRKVIDAFINNDVESVLSYATEDIRMGWPGYFDLEPGKDSVRKFFNDVPEMVSSRIGELFEEGDTVAGTGEITSREADGSLKKSFFCDIYTFREGKIAEIRSYMVFEQNSQSSGS